MIRHIVFFSVKEGQDIETVRKGLEQLATIPYSDVFEVLANSKVDPMCERIDLVVYAEFRTRKHSTLSRTIRLMMPRRSLCARCANCAFPPMW